MRFDCGDEDAAIHRRRPLCFALSLNPEVCVRAALDFLEAS
jgi:hypothetical protein